MNNQNNSMDNADHDLLIRLDESVKSLIVTIDKLNDNTIRRLNDIESMKVDRAEMDSMHKAFIDALDKEILARTTVDKDTEIRMRSMERFVYIAMGVVIILQLIVVPIVIKHFF